MKVFKFGGASVSSVDRIKNVASIVEGYSTDELVIIVSAMGKTTNALEKVVEAFYAGKKDEALQLFEVIKQSHLNTTKFLLVKKYNETLEELVNFLQKLSGSCTITSEKFRLLLRPGRMHWRTTFHLHCKCLF
jgi:aspartate kinase